MTGRVRIGTSGWHYKHWRGPFYPEKFPASRMLAFYLEHFDTVELNTTFYRLPRESGLKNWRDAAPSGFLFAAKGSRFITHMKKLKDPETALEKYFSCVDMLGDRLGPVLFQLPPFWEVNLERLDQFLKALPKHHRYAFEFRNATWHVSEVYRLLEKYDAAFCPFDLAGFQSPVVLTADFTYVRLHGPGGKYQGSYSTEALANWAGQITTWASELKAIYFYFDNDMAGYAVHNALELKRLCGLSD